MKAARNYHHFTFKPKRQLSKKKQTRCFFHINLDASLAKTVARFEKSANVFRFLNLHYGRHCVGCINDS